MVGKYVVGVDFGTESGRTVLVRVEDGEEVASYVHRYADGVIDEALPGGGRRLDIDWALQNPADYVETLRQGVPAVLRQASVRPEDVIGIGTDFTACTMLPIDARGTPLCLTEQFRDEPHAWVKLWKHHAAQPEADRVNEVARRRGEEFLQRYGGKISSEWFIPKALQILNEAPHIYRAADKLIEAADWIVMLLAGVERRNSCTAGYKAIWSKHAGYPSTAYFADLHPDFANVVDDKMSRDIYPLGALAGGLTPFAAELTGLLPGTAVAVGNVDAHVSVPATTVVEPWRMVMIMGTSTCHLVCGSEMHTVEGMCGVVEDGILPGFFGYEAGQSCVGDHFAWFVDNCVPEAYAVEARRQGLNVHQYLEQRAARLAPGESGLVALDWWNGNRSVLVDADLSGVLLGATLGTRPEEIYRALIEATAYGTRVIVDSFERNGVRVQDIVTCGGLPNRNHLLMQIYADVLGRELSIAASEQAGALGSAMHGAVAAGSAAGGYDTIQQAAARMAHLRTERYRPNAAAGPVYGELYAEYLRLHDYFGRGENDAMKRLKALKQRVRAQSAV
ncbi:MAG: ribulokinase [Anaerolineae bacterium]